MAHRFERLIALKRPLVMGAVVVVAALILYVCERSAQTLETAASTSIAQIQPLEQAITVAGTISAADILEITVPFDSTIKKLPVRLGESVAEGQPLVAFDTSGLIQRIREMEAAELKAAQAYQLLAGFDTSLDYARAQRAQVAALATVADNRRKLLETEALYAEGIVPRSELDGLRQQIRNDEQTLAGANDELRAVRQQASAANKRVAQIEYQNAKERLSLARRQLALATLAAPRSGTLIAAPVRQGRGLSLAVGASVTRGQSLFAIADMERLSVIAKVDESDAGRIREGQRIELTGPAIPIPLSGTIVTVAGEATPESGPGSVSYLITGLLDPIPAQYRKSVRLGMSAGVRIILEKRDAALVIPPSAVQGAIPDTTAMVVLPNGKQERRKIGIGIVTAQGVEVISGLKPGDAVVTVNK